MNVIIKKVENDENYFYIMTECNSYFGLKKEIVKDYVPKSGDKLTLDICFGSLIRGLSKDGKQIFYLTDEEIDEDNKKHLVPKKQKQIDDFVKEAPFLEQMFNLLPKLLQHRIQIFRCFSKDFRVNEEIYEMYAVFLAYKIFLHCFKLGDFTENIAKFDIEKYIKTHRLLSRVLMSDNQVNFAKNLAIHLYYDAKCSNINIKAPNTEDIKKSRAIFLGRAMSPLIGDDCTPRRYFIDRYIKTLQN